MLAVHISLFPITYLLTPGCRVLLEKLTGLQLVKFPSFYGTRRFITALTNVRHLSLSWANPIQSTYPHPTSWRSILILSTHLRLGLPSGLFPSGFPTKTLYAPISLLRKLKWQIPGESLAARYNWCQGTVPDRGPVVEKHWYIRTYPSHCPSYTPHRMSCSFSLNKRV